MIRTALNTAALALAAALCAGTVMAKLPPPSDEAKAKADEAKAKTAHGDKLAAFQLCKAMNQVANLPSQQKWKTFPVLKMESWVLNS